MNFHPHARESNQSSDQKRLLVINFGGIGDEILFLPTLKEIRSSLPNSSITLLVEPRSKGIAQITDLVDRVVTFDIKKEPLYSADIAELLSILRDGHYDIVVSSGGSSKVSLLLFLSGIPVRVGYRTGKMSELCLTHPVHLDKTVYAGKMYHSLSDGVRDAVGDTRAENGNDFVPQIVVDPMAVERMREVLLESGCKPGSQNGDLLVLLHPGTSKLAVKKRILKTWSAKCWVDLITRLRNCSDHRFKIVLAGGPDDEDVIASIMDELGSLASHVVSTFGKTKSLSDLAGLMSLSEILICVDSAPMHMGVAMQLPTVALFGPTNPALLMPKHPKFAAIWDRRQGERSMYDGLGVDIDPDEVYNAVINLANNR